MKKQQTKHFIDLDKITSDDLRSIIDLAKKLKTLSPSQTSQLLTFKNLAMIFEKNSTRTRISFEVGINQLGGHAVVMDKNNMQLGKSETAADTAKVLSGFVDMAMIRCKDHELLIEMAENATCPIINGLSDYSHPCQIMASILTIEEHLGKIAGKKLAWLGDANNVLNSYIHASKAFDYQLDIGIAEQFDFSNDEIQKAQNNGAKVNLYHDPLKATEGADVVITDTWISMGQFAENDDHKEKEIKLSLLKPYQVNSSLMKAAKPNAIFTHCLPAYRGFEVTAGVIDGQQSVVFAEAQNRLHAQKAIMLWLNDISL